MDSTGATRQDTDPLERDVRLALDAARGARQRVYYDADADLLAREAYYAGVDPDGPSRDLFDALVALLERTHDPRPRYKPAVHVYPWVDLHPDLKLRSIYSGRAFDPEEFIQADAEIARRRVTRLQELVREATLSPRVFETTFNALERQLPFNCEHVVPQSWFAEREPQRGDLHHLFACESRCNSFRGNTPYFDFPAREEAVRPDCGRSEDGGFEPNAGKGPAARATLYFLLRYPNDIGDAARELQRERLPLLLAWHAAEPVDEYELHRNAAIAEAQGNRNPLVDHPDWAPRIEFTAGFEPLAEAHGLPDRDAP